MAEEPAPALVATCPYRKSNPDVLTMQTSEVRVGHDAANGLNSTRCGVHPCSPTGACERLFMARYRYS
jgi:hypothetical protein